MQSKGTVTPPSVTSEENVDKRDGVIQLRNVTCVWSAGMDLFTKWYIRISLRLLTCSVTRARA
jgi:hypothetical protein